MAETIPQGASLSREITKNSQVPINSEHIELQSVGFNQGESSNSPETEPKGQEEVSYFRISSTLVPMLIVEIVLSFADLLSRDEFGPFFSGPGQTWAKMNGPGPRWAKSQK